MKQTIDSDHSTALHVKLSHAQAGDIGEGSLMFGYGCLAGFSLNGFGQNIKLDDDQLASGLLAVAEDGRKLSLLNCTRSGHTIYPEFVVKGDVRGSQFDSFEVRYSEVSEWFFQQTHVEGQLGEEIKWQTNPVPLVANVAMPSRNFRVESFYVATLEQSGEDRTLHQHFEFRFTATKNPFTPTEIRDLARRFGNLLSILLSHQCPIVSVDVTPKGGGYGRMYYGIHKSPPNGIHPQDRDKVTWRKFLTLKSDVDDCWEDVVNAFFRSKYREVIWSRLAGMQNYEGFWEYRVLGYVTLLDGYVTQLFGKVRRPKIPPTTKLGLLKAELENVQPHLNSTQLAAALDAASRVFSVSNTSFASKFQELVDSLDRDVIKIITLTQDDFRCVKKLRDAVAHGKELKFVGSDLTPIFEITNRIILLLTHLFFLDVGLGRDVFLRCLSRPHTELRMISKLDKVHLDRVLFPEKFIQVNSQELLRIQQRPRGLHCPCFERDLTGAITYSNWRSSELDKATRARGGGKFYELLGLPEDAVRYLDEAYFEDDAQTVSIYSTVIVDLARVPA